ncbi:hypothetical protein I3843_03G069800 [Carya illinoinensis]|nr:hypothetical protein I3843_03G069800 [Carya illinoinensis]
MHRPVILPLPGVGGSRCSVEPASRCTLHSMNHLSAWNGRASRKPLESDQLYKASVPSN